MKESFLIKIKSNNYILEIIDKNMGKVGGDEQENVEWKFVFFFLAIIYSVVFVIALTK